MFPKVAFPVLQAWLKRDLALAMVLLLLPLSLSAAVERTPTPFTALLDFEQLRRNPHSTQGSLPIWLERVEFATQALPEDAEAPEASSTVRITLRRLPGLSDRLLLRLFFIDQPGRQPMVSGWSETGRLLYQTPPLGDGLNLPTSESLSIATAGIDYLEIEAPGNGDTLRQALLASLQMGEAALPLDEIPLPPEADPFTLATQEEPMGDEEADTPSAPLPPLADPGDAFLFGRTRALLHAGFVRLQPGSEALQTVHFEFTLNSLPLLAMVTLALHNADPAAPLLSWMNGHPTGALSVQWPDLADPGYLGVVALSAPSAPTGFRYSGWLHGQLPLAARHLRVGKNTLSLQLSPGSGPVVLQRIGLQLKHHWHQLDYRIEPLPSLSSHPSLP